MEQVIGIGFIIAWFVYWGYVIIVNPDTFFRFQEQGDKRLKAASQNLGKAAIFFARNRRR